MYKVAETNSNKIYKIHKKRKKKKTNRRRNKVLHSFPEPNTRKQTPSNSNQPTHPTLQYSPS